MEDYQLLHLGAQACWVVFMFAFGACVGSLTNVLVYRLPLGLGVVTQGSRCPACSTELTWRENIPVLGWMLLKGRCRFCKTPISPEYPMVEALVGLIFAACFVLWYIMPPDAAWLGVKWGAVAPEWARADLFDAFPRLTWAPFLVLLVLLGSLTAMTLVDAKTFTIPLQIPWFATIAGIGLHTIGAMIVGPLRSTAPHTGWAIPIPGGSSPESATGWFLIGGSLGAVFGIGLSMVLLHFGLLRRSFADYQDWEDKTRAEMESRRRESSSPPAIDADEPGTGVLGVPGATVDDTGQAAGPLGEQASAGARRVLRFVMLACAAVVLLTAAGYLSARMTGLPTWAGLAAGVLVGPMVAAALLRTKSRPGATEAAGGDAEPTAPDMWIQYPHARREMFKELLFLTPCLGLGWLGGTLASNLAPQVPPFWLVVLCGTLMGYLIGGGIVWLVRIAGSLAFGKEAMGLGDVHLMAAVGACAGWIDAAIAFPLAAFVGLYWLIVARIGSGSTGRAMPFGPYLALATVLVIVCKPLVEMGLSAIIGRGINLP